MANPQFVNPASSNLTPESMFEQKVKAGRDGIQQEFQREWDTINQQAKINRFSPQKHQQLLATAQTKAADRAAKFDQGYQAQLSNFKNLEQLQNQGVITNATEAKWRMVLGPEAEKLMSVTQSGSSMKQYSELDIYRNKLESNAKQFRVQPSGKIPSWWKPRRWEETAPEELEIFDPSKLAYDAKGNVKEGSTAGAWRKAKLDEIQAYGLIKEELGRVTEEQNMLLRPNTSSLMNTAVKSPRIGGSIKDQTKMLLNQREGNAQQQTDNDPLGLR